MKVLIVLLLSSVVATAADTGVSKITNVSTNAETGAIYLEETFTRNGQTNLVRKTTTEDGEVSARVQRIYQGGELVAYHYLVNRPVHRATEAFSAAPSTYTVSLSYSPENELTKIIIHGFDGDDYIFDGFTVTNKVFHPVENELLRIVEEE